MGGKTTLTRKYPEILADIDDTNDECLPTYLDIVESELKTRPVEKLFNAQSSAVITAITKNIHQ